MLNDVEIRVEIAADTFDGGDRFDEHHQIAAKPKLVQSYYLHNLREQFSKDYIS